MAHWRGAVQLYAATYFTNIAIPCDTYPTLRFLAGGEVFGRACVDDLLQGILIWLEDMWLEDQTTITDQTKVFDNGDLGPCFVPHDKVAQ